MNITHNVHIDLAFAPSGISLPIKVMQGDGYSRSIAFHLTSNGAPWTAPQDVGICVGYYKPDGTGGLYNTLPNGTLAWSIQDNVVSVAIAPQVMTVPGEVELAVSLLSGEAVISTFPVTLYVTPLPGYNGTSENYTKLFGLLPMVTVADNGKILKVVDGAWAAAGVSFYTGEVEVN